MPLELDDRHIHRSYGVFGPGVLEYDPKRPRDVRDVLRRFDTDDRRGIELAVNHLRRVAVPIPVDLVGRGVAAVPWAEPDNIL